MLPLYKKLKTEQAGVAVTLQSLDRRFPYRISAITQDIPWFSSVPPYKFQADTSIGSPLLSSKSFQIHDSAMIPPSTLHNLKS
jgi:hypothetical protein